MYSDANQSSHNATEFSFDPAMAHNIQRSSSHESHLRNKIQPSTLIANSSHMAPVKTNKKANINSCENIYRSDASDCSNRGQSGNLLAFMG